MDQQKKTIIYSSCITILVILLILSLFKAPLLRVLAKQYAQEAQKENTGTGALGGETNNFFTQESFVVDTVKKTNPAVVAIVISKEVPKYETYYQQQPDPFGGIFGDNNPFGNIFNIPMQRQNGTEKKDVGGGSGFFVTTNGLIVTNKHVVEDKTAEYTVFTNDGKKHTAKVVARDFVLDIALIKIEGTGYTALDLGDSDKLQVGQSVIAIGNALGEFRNTVSVGVVSGLSRSITAGDGTGNSELLDHVIQTDAAINPGNSGGPLLNLSGKVVGVNVAVAQGSQSIAFALPINTVRSVIESVKETGKIVRPYIGVRYVAITAELKNKNNLSVDYGVLVQRGKSDSELAVIPGSPGDKAGIVENDIILEVDGTKLDADHELSTIVRGKKVGDVINLKLLHKGVEKTTQVTLEAAPQS
jgi:serine protease Do